LYAATNVTSQHENILLANAEIASTKIIFEGKRSYVKQKIDRCKAMAEHCMQKWNGLPVKLSKMDGRDASVIVEC